MQKICEYEFSQFWQKSLIYQCFAAYSLREEAPQLLLLFRTLSKTNTQRRQSKKHKDLLPRGGVVTIIQLDSGILAYSEGMLNLQLWQAVILINTEFVCYYEACVNILTERTLHGML